ncbi:MAG: UvrABC system protein C [Candidatus Omnitrophica bacterium ADurb.Bin277]|nr:MAG: UvrABC system protein C [Candidatus Omnitrophica bacterium ADurb.Bin277]
MADEAKLKNKGFSPSSGLSSRPDPVRTLRKIVAKLPLSPGCYLMKDSEGDILYIGKAKFLQKRVRSYLAVRRDLPKIAVMMSKVRSIDHIETPTEVDALLLEAHLIKKYRPRYNKELKDDKSYPLLKITGEKFPRLVVTRQRSDQKSAYYGPYTDSKLLRQAVALINSLFPIRKCQTMPKTACLYYHIHQCLAPCIRPEVGPAYGKIIEEVRRFLGGGKRSFLEYLTERMDVSAKELRFEDAQFFKEQIESLSQLRRKRFFPQSPSGGIGLSATMELKRALKMDALPVRIVCFDVSNIQGDEAVASKVSFYRELPDKIHYRRYKIRAVKGINDYAMISEALTRMLRGIKEGREAFIPDLIMIDGGKGHLNTALRAIEAEETGNAEVISIAKRFEYVFSPKFREPLVFHAGSPVLHLLEKIRDEAHRFAITFHRSLKSKNLERSFLDNVAGIGEKRKKALLRHFASPELIKSADIEQLMKVPGMDRRTAESLRSFFAPHP